MDVTLRRGRSLQKLGGVLKNRGVVLKKWARLLKQ